MRTAAMLAAALLSPWLATAAVLNPGDILVGNGFPERAVIRIDVATGAQSILQGSQGAQPQDLAVEVSGDVLIGDSWSGVGVARIRRVNVDAGTKTVVSADGYFRTARGIALESTGDILVCDSNPPVIRVDPVTGSQSIVSPRGIFERPSAIDIDRTGDLFITDFDASAVIRVDPVTGSQTVVTSGGNLSFPSSIAIAESGEIFVTNRYATPAAVVRVDPVTGEQTVFSSEGVLSAPTGIAIDANGDILVVDFELKAVVWIDRETSHQRVIIEGPLFSAPMSIAVVPGNPPDADMDGIPAGYDNCPTANNSDQSDTDSNGVGDACNDAEDPDGDDLADEFDNCPTAFNPAQDDRDFDKVGDACDPFPDDPDNVLAQCMLDRSTLSADTDEDGVVDISDRCPDTLAEGQVDLGGCSADQFCSSIDANTRAGARNCKRADFKNDEPLMRRSDRDCEVAKAGSGRADDRCVAVP